MNEAKIDYAKIRNIAEKTARLAIGTTLTLGGVFLFSQAIVSCGVGTGTKQWRISNQREYCVLSDQIFGDNAGGYGFGSYVVSRNKKPLADLNNDGLVALVEKIEMYRRAGIDVSKMEEFPVLTLEQLRQIRRSFPAYLTAPNQADLT